MVIGALNVCPPSFEVATTWTVAVWVVSSFSDQKASTVPLDATAICPVSRKPWPMLLLAPLTCTGLDQLNPPSLECATNSFTLPLPAQLAQKTAQKT